jgi:hypothetical protein
LLPSCAANGSDGSAIVQILNIRALSDLPELVGPPNLLSSITHKRQEVQVFDRIVEHDYRDRVAERVLESQGESRHLTNNEIVFHRYLRYLL